PNEFQADPVEQFLAHVWVSPYYEDDIDLIKETMGADHMLFGSDYPHAEGLEVPTDFIYDIPNFTDAEAKAMMRDNAWDVITPRSALAA
ncbi:MAG: amidohydrolase family protein, partial [bacterium]|nr:amidohydrolase family protein [bacterium]